MGSGKGKSRRVQTSLPAGAQVSEHMTFTEGKWNEFIDANDLMGVMMHDYYLGSTTKCSKDEAYRRLVTEFFRDAVAVGAITLPSPYTVEDFELGVVGKGRFTQIQ